LATKVPVEAAEKLLGEVAMWCAASIYVSVFMGG